MVCGNIDCDFVKCSFYKNVRFSVVVVVNGVQTRLQVFLQ